MLKTIRCIVIKGEIAAFGLPALRSFVKATLLQNAVAQARRPRNSSFLLRSLPNLADLVSQLHCSSFLFGPQRGHKINPSLSHPIRNLYAAHNASPLP